MPLPVLVITGAAGGVGGALWPRLAEHYRLRLLDMIPVPDVPPGVESVVGDIRSRDHLLPLLEGADAVLHLAGERRAIATWDELIGPNLTGPATLLEAAVQSGVGRVVLASSCHASGGYDAAGITGIDPAWAPRPCCRYGATKAFGEATGRMYADTTDTSVIALRLGAVSPEPYGRTGQAYWLSLRDLYAVTAAALTADVRFGVYFGGSANARAYWDMSAGERDLGFAPVDDAADHDIDLSQPMQSCFVGAGR